MCLVDKKVNHKKFGEGIIKSCDGKYLHIIFGEQEKIFSYPSAFEKFITIEDKEAEEKIKADIDLLYKKALEIQEEKKKKEIQYVSQPIESQKNMAKYAEMTKSVVEDSTDIVDDSLKVSPKVTKVRAKASSIKNLAIKFNYCDGGQIDDKIGYTDICSSSQRDYNVSKVRSSKICNSQDCICKKFLYGEVTEEEFKKVANSDMFICNERELLKKWRIKVNSSKLVGALKDSLIVMTTKFRSIEEKDRFIFGAFLVSGVEIDGDSEFILADSEYRIELKKSEAVKMKFWDYYTSAGKTKNSWGTTVYKSLTPEDSLLILKDILKFKIGTDEEEKARKICKRFALVNGLNMNDSDEQDMDVESQMELNF